MNIHDDILTRNSGASDDRPAIETPSLDLAKYRAFLPELGLSGDAGDEFLAELWKLSFMFVYANVGVETIPAIFPEIFDLTSAVHPAPIDSKDDEASDG